MFLNNSYKSYHWGATRRGQWAHLISVTAAILFVTLGQCHRSIGITPSWSYLRGKEVLQISSHGQRINKVNDAHFMRRFMTMLKLKSFHLLYFVANYQQRLVLISPGMRSTSPITDKAKMDCWRSQSCSFSLDAGWWILLYILCLCLTHQKPTCTTYAKSSWTGYW